MFDSRKIDAFFDGDKPFENVETGHKVLPTKIQRFIKLGFPCIAAILLGLMVIVPNIKKSVDLQDITTLPRKDELEKLHVEDTVFYITDRKNRVSKLTANNIDETAPGSDKVKIINPRGSIPTDSGNIDITSEIGYFNQNDSVLDMHQNVKATIDGDTVITTESATYNFKDDVGFGEQTIQAVGSWGKLQAVAFTYDKNQELLTLLGENKVWGKKGNLSSIEKTEIYRSENKVISFGKATITQNSTVLTADKIIGYFSADNRHEIQKAEAYGNVAIKTENEIAYGAEGFYDRKNGKVELYGYDKSSAQKNGRVEVHQKDNVLYAGKIEALLSSENKQQIKQINAYEGVYVKTPKGTARGNRGIYNPQKNVVELFDAVTIEQNGNFIKGTHAETNLNTSLSRISADKSSGGRISGTFYKKKRK